MATATILWAKTTERGPHQLSLLRDDDGALSIVAHVPGVDERVARRIKIDDQSLPTKLAFEMIARAMGLEE